MPCHLLNIIDGCCYIMLLICLYYSLFPMLYR
ncbi:hypothetical protein [Enterococcus phage PEF7b]